MQFIYNDGGRQEHFKGEAGDCGVRAIAIGTSKPYKTVYDKLFALNREKQKKVHKKNRYKYTSPRNGLMGDVIKEYLLAEGWKWYPTMQIGAGCKVHLRREELPLGVLILRVSKHFTCVIDGVLYDTFDCSREGTRCVYGYFKKGEK